MAQQRPERTGIEDLQTQNLDLLIEHGLRKGFLTRSDIVDCIPEAEYDDDAYARILEAIEEAGIDYVDEEPEATTSGEELEQDGSPDGESEEEALLADGDLTLIDPEDMARLYIREAARTPLLKAEEEVQLAKRIELGRMAQQELNRGRIPEKRRQELCQIISAGKDATA